MMRLQYRLELDKTFTPGNFLPQLRDRNNGDTIQGKHTAGVNLESPPHAGPVFYHFIKEIAAGVRILDEVG